MIGSQKNKITFTETGRRICDGFDRELRVRRRERNQHLRDEIPAHETAYTGARERTFAVLTKGLAWEPVFGERDF